MHRMKIKKIKIDELSVLVIDDIFESQEIAKIHRNLLVANFSPLGASKEATKEFNEIMTEFDVEDFSSTRIGKEFHEKIQNYYSSSVPKCYDVLANAISFGDHTFCHQDAPIAESITALYFANSEWLSNWGGELILFGSSGDSEAVVGVRPGRIVFFPSQIFHRAGVPNRICGEIRLTVSATFYINGYLPK